MIGSAHSVAGMMVAFLATLPSIITTLVLVLEYLPEMHAGVPVRRVLLQSSLGLSSLKKLWVNPLASHRSPQVTGALVVMLRLHAKGLDSVRLLATAPGAALTHTCTPTWMEGLH
jgi:hypothetical protein